MYHLSSHGFTHISIDTQLPAISHTHSVCIRWFVTWQLPLSQFTFMEFKCVFDFNRYVESSTRTLYIVSVFENHFNLPFDSMSIYQFNEISYNLHTVCTVHWSTLSLVYEHNNSDRENNTRPNQTRNRNWKYLYVFEDWALSLTDTADRRRLQSLSLHLWSCHIIIIIIFFWVGNFYSIPSFNIQLFSMSGFCCFKLLLPYKCGIEDEKSEIWNHTCNENSKRTVRRK